VQSNSSSVAAVGPRASRRRRRRPITGRIVWGGLLRVLQRITHYKHGDRLEFRISYSVRDLLSDKGRAVKDQVEALVQAVQKAGSYQAKEEAARAVHAVMDGLKDRVPPEVLTKLSESSPVRETARLGRAAAQRFQRDANRAGASGSEPVVTSELLGMSVAAEPVAEVVSTAEAVNTAEAAAGSATEAPRV
jgi:hypothetical protein